MQKHVFVHSTQHKSKEKSDLIFVYGYIMYEPLYCKSCYVTISSSKEEGHATQLYKMKPDVLSMQLKALGTNCKLFTTVSYFSLSVRCGSRSLSFFSHGWFITCPFPPSWLSQLSFNSRPAQILPSHRDLPLSLAFTALWVSYTPEKQQVQCLQASRSKPVSSRCYSTPLPPIIFVFNPISLNPVTPPTAALYNYMMVGKLWVTF